MKEKYNKGSRERLMGVLNRFRAPKATMSVALDKPQFSLSEPMKGKISVSSSEEFDADELRIELWVTEWTRAMEKKGSGEDAVTVTAEQNARLYEGKIAVARRMRITKGFDKQFPFSIPLPPNIPPSYRGHNARNTWNLKGVVAVKGRPDVTSHIMEVQISP